MKVKIWKNCLSTSQAFSGHVDRASSPRRRLERPERRWWTSPSGRAGQASPLHRRLERPARRQRTRPNGCARWPAKRCRGASVRSVNATSRTFRLCRQLWMAASSGLLKQLKKGSSSGSWWMQAWCCPAGRPRTTSDHTSNFRGKGTTKSPTATEQQFPVCVDWTIFNSFYFLFSFLFIILFTSSPFFIFYSYVFIFASFDPVLVFVFFYLFSTSVFFTRLFSTHHCQSFPNNFPICLSFVRRRSFPQQFSNPPEFCEAQKFSATIFQSA